MSFENIWLVMAAGAGGSSASASLGAMPGSLSMPGSHAMPGSLRLPSTRSAGSLAVGSGHQLTDTGAEYSTHGAFDLPPTGEPTGSRQPMPDPNALHRIELPVTPSAALPASEPAPAPEPLLGQPKIDPRRPLPVRLPPTR